MNPFTFFLSLLASISTTNYTNISAIYTSYPNLSYTPRPHSHGLLYYKYVDDDF
jgi:hypothetical protein